MLHRLFMKRSRRRKSRLINKREGRGVTLMIRMIRGKVICNLMEGKIRIRKGRI